MAVRPIAELWIKITLPRGRWGMSYRRAWLLVDELNQLFASPVVAKWQGGQSKGGASLRPFGEDLVRRYEILVERAHDANAELLVEIGREAARAPRARNTRTRR